jgi:hypothetical protein
MRLVTSFPLVKFAHKVRKVPQDFSQIMVPEGNTPAPFYVLQSPGLVESCVGLYVPLLEFNQVAGSGPELLGCAGKEQKEAN